LLYGSRAKGNYRHGSDIDLALEGRGLDETQLPALEIRLDDLLLPYCIDLSRLADIQNEALRDHIRRVGRVFYEAQSILSSPLAGPDLSPSDALGNPPHPSRGHRRCSNTESASLNANPDP